MRVPRTDDDDDAFASFVRDVEPRLRRALTALRGFEAGRDATAEALAYAWENWHHVREMTNPVGYLYRVGQSRSKPRLQRVLHGRAASDSRDYEPGLDRALARLPERQRAAVILVKGSGLTYQEAAEALSLPRSTVATHVKRALAQLREELGAQHG